MIISHFPLFATIAGGIAAPIVSPVFAAVIGGEIFNLIRQTRAVAQVGLIILLIFIIMSRSVILTKCASIKLARAHSGPVLPALPKAQPAQDVAAVSEP